MAIERQCEKCGHVFNVSHEDTGKQYKCPHCGNDTYIPTPEDELEELPLSPEDQAEVQREEQLQAERRRLDRILAAESNGGESDDQTTTSASDAAVGRHSHTTPPGTGRTSIKGVVITYLTAMRETDLGRAEQALALLATRRDDVLRVIDRLAADQIPPAEMSDVPPAVYQGFLKTLRSRL